MARLRPLSLLVAATMAGGVLTSACQPDGERAERAFGSRKMLALRDPTMALRGFNQAMTKLFYVTDCAVDQDGGSVVQLCKLWQLDLASGQVDQLADRVSRFHEGVGEEGRPPPLFIYTGGLASGTLVILEPDTGRSTVIDGVTGGLLHHSLRQPLALVRTTTDGGRQLWFGAYDALVPGPPELEISSLLAADSDSALVLASTHRPDPGTTVQDPGLGVWRVDLATGVRAVVVPAIVTAQPGTDPAAQASMTSTSLDPAHPPQRFCWSAQERYLTSQAGGDRRCLLVYRRLMLDGSQRLFTRYLDGDAETALPYPLDGRLSGPVSGAPVIVWEGRGALGEENASDWHFVTWNLESGQFKSCLGRSLTLFWRPSGVGFATLGAVLGSAGPLALQWHAAGELQRPCRVIAQDETTYVTFSDDDAHMAWMTRSRGERSTLWVANADGEGARVLASDGFFDWPQFMDDRRILFTRSGPDGSGLSWVDITEEPSREHPVVDHLFRQAMYLNARWLLLGHEHNAQDETGTLAVVKIDDGEEHPISRAVLSFIAMSPYQAAEEGRAELPIVYVVKGRHPSDQDGIWLASLPLAAFP
jgi:hypothetical protein